MSDDATKMELDFQMAVDGGYVSGAMALAVGAVNGLQARGFRYYLSLDMWLSPFVQRQMALGGGGASDTYANSEHSLGAMQQPLSAQQQAVASQIDSIQAKSKAMADGQLQGLGRLADQAQAQAGDGWTKGCFTTMQIVPGQVTEVTGLRGGAGAAPIGTGDVPSKPQAPTMVRTGPIYEWVAGQQRVLAPAPLHPSEGISPKPQAAPLLPPDLDAIGSFHWLRLEDKGQFYFVPARWTGKRWDILSYPGPKEWLPFTDPAWTYYGKIEQPAAPLPSDPKVARIWDAVTDFASR